MLGHFKFLGVYVELTNKQGSLHYFNLDVLCQKNKGTDDDLIKKRKKRRKNKKKLDKWELLGAPLPLAAQFECDWGEVFGGGGHDDLGDHAVPRVQDVVKALLQQGGRLGHRAVHHVETLLSTQQFISISLSGPQF